MITLTVILIVKLVKANEEIKKWIKFFDEHLACDAEAYADWQKRVDEQMEKGQGYFIEVCKLQKERLFWIRQIKTVVSKDKMKELYVERDNIMEEYCKANGFEW